MILITGATGSHGSTGFILLQKLAKMNVNAVAMVRQDDFRAEAIRNLGHRTVVADFFDLAALRKAFEGISSVFFSYPIRDGIVNAAANVALAAKEAGVKKIVHNTMAVTMDLSPSPFARQSFL